MLVLTRRVDTKLYLGPDICISVIDVDKGRVRLGIDAPASCIIMRDEIINKDIPFEENFKEKKHGRRCDSTEAET